MQKKGISPILSSVIIILIVVALGAIVSVFMRNMTEKKLNEIGAQAAEGACGSSVNLDVATVGSNYEICKDETNKIVSVVLSNKGSEDIIDFVFTVVGSDNVYENQSMGITLATKQTKKINFTYNSTAQLGTVREYRFSPIIEGTPQKPKVICIDSAEIRPFDRVPDC